MQMDRGVSALCHYTGCAQFQFFSQKRHIFAFMRYKLRWRRKFMTERNIFSQQTGPNHSTGTPTLSQRNHMKSRQENKRWLNTCHSKEETQNLYPWVYLIVPDTVDIWRDQLARRSWRNPLRIATGSNQTDFRGPRHNPQLAKVDRQSCLRTPWQKPIKMTCKRQKTDKRKASSFPGMKATYYHHEHGRFQVQEGLLWLQSTLTSMILHTRHQPRALDRLQKRVFNYLFRKLSKQGKEQ